jgi:hypothetical protein
MECNKLINGNLTAVKLHLAYAMPLRELVGRQQAAFRIALKRVEV